MRYGFAPYRHSKHIFYLKEWFVQFTVERLTC